MNVKKQLMIPETRAFFMRLEWTTQAENRLNVHTLCDSECMLSIIIIVTSNIDHSISFDGINLYKSWISFNIPSRSKWDSEKHHGSKKNWKPQAMVDSRKLYRFNSFALPPDSIDMIIYLLNCEWNSNMMCDGIWTLIYSNEQHLISDMKSLPLSCLIILLIFWNYLVWAITLLDHRDSRLGNPFSCP